MKTDLFLTQWYRQRTIGFQGEASDMNPRRIIWTLGISLAWRSIRASRWFACKKAAQKWLYQLFSIFTKEAVQQLFQLFAGTTSALRLWGWSKGYSIVMVRLWVYIFPSRSVWYSTQVRLRLLYQWKQTAFYPKKQSNNNDQLQLH